MKNIRYDFLTRSKIIYAKKRGSRPNHFIKEKVKSVPKYREDCPFCVGNEDMTPDKITEFENPYGIKIISNKYPAVSTMDSETYGMHYVIIEDKNHNGDEYKLSRDKFYYILKAYKSAISEMEKDSKIKYIQIFKNHKEYGGASLEHPHSQIIAFDEVPDKIIALCGDECYLCNEIRNEVDLKLRVIARNDDFIAYCPYASMSGYQVRIAAINHKSYLADFDNGVLHSLAEIYTLCLNAIKSILGNFPYNLLVYSYNHDSFHFFMDIVPRLANFGGLELSTGMSINSKFPEEAAEELKEYTC